MPSSFRNARNSNKFGAAKLVTKIMSSATRVAPHHKVKSSVKTPNPSMKNKKKAKQKQGKTAEKSKLKKTHSSSKTDEDMTSAAPQESGGNSPQAPVESSARPIAQSRTKKGQKVSRVNMDGTISQIQMELESNNAEGTLEMPLKTLSQQDEEEQRKARKLEKKKKNIEMFRKDPTERAKNQNDANALKGGNDSMGDISRSTLENLYGSVQNNTTGADKMAAPKSILKVKSYHSDSSNIKGTDNGTKRSVAKDGQPENKELFEAANSALLAYQKSHATAPPTQNKSSVEDDFIIQDIKRRSRLAPLAVPRTAFDVEGKSAEDVYEGEASGFHFDQPPRHIHVMEKDDHSQLSSNSDDDDLTDTVETRYSRSSSQPKSYQDRNELNRLYGQHPDLEVGGSYTTIKVKVTEDGEESFLCGCCQHIPPGTQWFLFGLFVFLIALVSGIGIAVFFLRER